MTRKSKHRPHGAADGHCRFRTHGRRSANGRGKGAMASWAIVRGERMFEGLPDWLKVLMTGVGGLGVGGYAVARRLKTDNTSDKLDAKAQAIIGRLENQLDAERKNSAHLGDVIDRLATERNTAVQQVGRLEGTVHALESEVGRLREEIQVLERKNSELTTEIGHLSVGVKAMLEQNAQLLEVARKAGVVE